MRKTPRLLIAVGVIIFVVVGTFLAIKLAKGYRPSLTSRALKETGLLSVTSYPKGASVFINDKLTTATDDTLNLPPGEYQVKIAKDGYIPWEKMLQLEAELVTQTNTRLFPSVPDLSPLTFSGALKPLPSPDGQKIIFGVNQATTPDKNGLYLLDLVTSPLSFRSQPRQIVRNNQDHDFTQAQLSWSPDSNQIVASFNLGKKNESNILLNAGSFNDASSLKDVTAQLPVMLKDWNDSLDKKDHQLFETLPDEMQKIATSSATALFWAPNEKRLMYTATASAQIPDNLIPPLPARSTQQEARQLEPNSVYVYDLEEDKNFFITSTTLPETPTSLLQNLANRYLPLSLQPLQWYPDSNHLIIIESDKLIIAEYDGTNRQVVYAGPFSEQFAFSWPNGSRLVILASLNGGSNAPPNLYSINLK
jgi:hypothetical protein